MRLVTIDVKLYKTFKQDKEFLHNAKRPCVLVLRLKYKGHNHHFAIPVRSNISASSEKNLYFPLPPRPNTRPKNRHGLHYIKMFPVRVEHLQKYHTAGNISATLMKAIIDKNTKRIVMDCQNYLYEYEKGKRHKFATDIDFLLEQLNNISNKE